MNPSRLCAMALLLAVALLAPRAAHAARSYDSCTGFIESVPAVITTQGTWCLRRNFATTLQDGAAIEIKAGNVTLDCNDFKLGDGDAPAGTRAIGIRASGQINTTVRNCIVRAFHTGIVIEDAQGASIEDNRTDGSRHQGIHATGKDVRVVRNSVLDTGRDNGESEVYGIRASGDIIDNTVTLLKAYGSAASATGIDQVDATPADIRGNRVRELSLQTNDGTVVGIAGNTGSSIVDNQVLQGAETHGLAIHGGAFCTGNVSRLYDVAISDCGKTVDNVALNR
jgi:hypothetical protein